MSYPLDQISNATQPVTLAGRVYQIRQPKLREWGRVQAWLRSTAPDPIRAAVQAVADAEAGGRRIAEHIQRHLFAAATDEVRRCPPRVGSPAWLQAMDTADPDGTRFITEVFVINGIEATADEIDAISDGLQPGELSTLMAVSLWGHVPAPKAEAVEAPPPPSPTTGASSSSAS